MNSDLFSAHRFFLVSEQGGRKHARASNVLTWTKQIIKLIEQHSGEISDQITDGVVIILENPSQLVKQITQLIKKHNVTS